MAVGSTPPLTYGTKEIKFTQIKPDTPEKGKTTVTYKATYPPVNPSLYSTTNVTKVAFSEKIPGLQFKPDATGTNFVGSVSFTTGSKTECYKIVDSGVK
ncbi:hypothetical protein J6Q66_03415 [bacterium]|nr:hypothetical protein [bacterium]